MMLTILVHTNKDQHIEFEANLGAQTFQDFDIKYYKGLLKDVKLEKDNELYFWMGENYTFTYDNSLEILVNTAKQHEIVQVVYSDLLFNKAILYNFSSCQSAIHNGFIGDTPFLFKKPCLPVIAQLETDITSQFKNAMVAVGQQAMMYHVPKPLVNYTSILSHAEIVALRELFSQTEKPKCPCGQELIPHWDGLVCNSCGNITNTPQKFLEKIAISKES
jgi:hypothetical protein